MFRPPICICGFVYTRDVFEYKCRKNERELQAASLIKVSHLNTSAIHINEKSDIYVKSLSELTTLISTDLCKERSRREVFLLCEEKSKKESIVYVSLISWGRPKIKNEIFFTLF